MNDDQLSFQLKDRSSIPFSLDNQQGPEFKLQLVDQQQKVNQTQRTSNKLIKKSELNKIIRKGSYVSSQQTYTPPANMLKLTILMIIICISPYYVGLTIFLSAASSIETYINYYQIPIGQTFAFSIINGVVPFGGLLGAFTMPYVMKYTNKRDLSIIHFVLSFIFCGITLIPNFAALLIGRFLLGVTCSWQNAVGASLIRDFAPIKLRSVFGCLYVVFRVSGITSAFAFGYIFNYQPNVIQFCALNMIPFYLTIIQLILFKMFCPMSPSDLIAKNKNEQLKQVISLFYSKQLVDLACENAIRQFKTSSKVFSYVHQNKTIKQKQKALQKLSYYQIKSNFIGLQTSLVRQFCGVNYLTIYSKFVLQNLHFEYSAAGPILINVVQIFATFVGLYIVFYFKRRNLFIFGVTGVSISAYLLATFQYFHIWSGVLASQVLFMLFTGSILSPVSWPYPPQIVTPLRLKYTSVVS